MNTQEPAFPCSRCRVDATHKQGHQWLCPKHYRFGQMRNTAKRYGKYVPSHEELQNLLNSKFICVDCNEAMVWLSRENKCKVASLQHYRDGSIAIVCRSCNTRHARMIGDSFRLLPKNQKYCPSCKISKDSANFYLDNARTGELKRKSWCKQCCSKKHLQWRIKNGQKRQYSVTK